MKHTLPALAALSVTLCAGSPISAFAQGTTIALRNTKMMTLGPSIPPIDSMPAIMRATKACGPKATLRCKAGWDDALLSITTAAILPVGQPAVARILVTNIGGAAAPEIPAVLFLNNEASVRWTVPALKGNDSAAVIVRFTPKHSEYDITLRARLDPDHVTTAKHRGNNEVSAEAKVEGAPRIEIGDFSGPRRAEEGKPLVTSFTVRNVSRTVALKNAFIQGDVGGSYIQPASKFRCPLPELGPQQELSGELVFTGIWRTANSRSELAAYIHAAVKGDEVDTSRGITVVIY